MAQINKSSEYFNTKLYTGNGSTQSITGVNFQPDWVWVKSRSNATNHSAYDIIRGVQQELRPNSTDAEATRSTGLTSFDSDGFSAGNNININNSGYTYASWNWKAGGTASSNTDGSITSNVSANTTSGFSIVSYTGNNTTGATVGHGLGSAPKMIIFKSRSGVKNWITYHDGIGNTKALFLNLTQAPGTGSDYWNNTSPDSSVFTLGDNSNHNDTSADMIAYCFAEKKGFSKAFSYTGNGSTDGSFCYLGFRPAFIMIKCSSLSSDWNIWDNKRPDYNVVNRSLEPHQSDAETVSAGRDIDILSNGFKARGTSSSMNSSGATYVGIAFAENPLVGTNNTPAVAR